MLCVAASETGEGSFNFMAAVAICSDFGASQKKSVTVSTVSPFICYEVMGLDAMILVFCIQKIIKTTDKLLEIINELSKLVGYKVKF